MRTFDYSERDSENSSIRTNDEVQAMLRRAAAISADTAKGISKLSSYIDEEKIKERAEKAAERAKKALKAVVKAAIKETESLITFIFAGGWIAIIVILVICMLGFVASSAYGIFAGNEVGKATGDTGSDLSSAISTINAEYYDRIQKIRSSIPELENTTVRINGEVGTISGVWQDVLAVYAVDTANGENAMPAIDFDEDKLEKLRETFWSMVSISYNIIERAEKEEYQTTDDTGAPMTETIDTIHRDVIIDVTTRNAADAALLFSFSDEQNGILLDLMSDRFTESWNDLIYGYSFGDEDIVAVAVSQIGNTGGEPYWRWYGLSSRTAWCAIYVSWCADQCGYLDEGIITKFSWVPDGVNWFQSRGQWKQRGYTPMPGDIIFFDWDGDGAGNHVGIVEYCEGNTVHTIEGNTGDACKRRQYSVDSSSILGYGIPMYL